MKIIINFIFCNILANTIFREMDAVGEWSHSSDMDCEKDKQRIRRLVKPLEINPNLTIASFFPTKNRLKGATVKLKTA